MQIPTFGYYYMQCHESGIKNEFLQTYKEDGWKIRPEKLYKTLKDNSDIGMVLLNYPANPTGVVMTESYGKSLAEVFKLFPNLYIASDEILMDIVLDPKIKPFSIGSIAELAPRVITLNGVSKSRDNDFRVSFACAPSQIAEEYDYSHHIGGASSFLHGIAAQSLIDNQENRDYLLNNIKSYKENIDSINSIINKVNKNLSKHFHEEDGVYIKPYLKDPEAGNVYLLDFSGLKAKIFSNGRKLKTGLDVADFLLEKSDVAMVPGECFFISRSEMVLRLASSIPIEEIEKGFERIGEAIISNLINPPKTSIVENKVTKMLTKELIREK